MTKLNLSSSEGFFVSYDLADIKNIKHGKAGKFYDKSECESNGLKVSDSIIIISFKNGDKTSFGDNWIATFA
jgi:hypothetical protein